MVNIFSYMAWTRLVPFLSKWLTASKIEPFTEIVKKPKIIFVKNSILEAVKGGLSGRMT